MLFYMPLESYAERYTLQWSAPKTGWLERRWLAAGVPYLRIDPKMEPRAIKVGSVVDGVGRAAYAFAQTKRLLELAELGGVTSEDTIYFDDFWHPGFEAIPYAFHLMGIKPKMYAFLHAQTVDEFDFTYPMRKWMNPFEKGIAASLDGIFVCCQTLKDLVCDVQNCAPMEYAIASPEKVHVTGHPFNSEEVMERMPKWYNDFRIGRSYPMPERENKIIWSSRWDKEKNPDFFLLVADALLTEKEDLTFVICTGAKELRSNEPELLGLLKGMMRKWPKNIILKEGLTKEEYYAELCTATVQMNTADQDFVAITLLEAAVAGCCPVYPNFRSFPETLRENPYMLYKHLDKKDAMRAVRYVFHVYGNEALHTAKAIEMRSWIYRRFDDSWARQLKIMGIESGKEVPSDPFAQSAY